MATTNKDQEAFINKACEILQQHHKMSKTNTVYNPDRSIKDRDVDCFCGYKGSISWAEHVLQVFYQNDISLISVDEAAELAIAKAR